MAFVGGTSEIAAMCDLGFVHLLREKVRHQEAEERRSAEFGKSPRERFVPWTMPSPASQQAAPEAAPMTRA